MGGERGKKKGPAEKRGQRSERDDGEWNVSPGVAEMVLQGISSRLQERRSGMQLRRARAHSRSLGMQNGDGLTQHGTDGPEKQ